MPHKSHSVVVEADEKGCFVRLPEGWAIEPEGSDVAIVSDLENGSYLVKPLIDENGQPNCRFTFPENHNT